MPTVTHSEPESVQATFADASIYRLWTMTSCLPVEVLADVNDISDGQLRLDHEQRKDAIWAFILET
jgi:hypothetical protein